MFKHSMKEQTTNRVVIDDIDEDTLIQLLRYIYQGMVRLVYLLFWKNTSVGLTTM